MLAGRGIGITGAASTVVRDHLTKNVILVSNDTGNIAASSVTIDSIVNSGGGGTTVPYYNINTK